jgi:hypothetical protein
MLNKDTLYELRMQLARFPYSQTLRILYLKNLFMLRDASFGEELRKSGLYIPDRAALFYIIEGGNYDLSAVKNGDTGQTVEAEPTDDGADRTMTLINAFLATMPDEVDEPAGLDYSGDYTSYLLNEDEENPDEPDGEQPQLRGIELIDDFIEQSDKKQPQPLPPLPAASDSVAAQEEEEDDSCFTETLAKIYIKQQRYEKALEIIKKLSLKYPKKNAYFADHIRFLDKLIINAKSK